MDKEDGRKLTRQAQHERRKQAVRLHRRGMSIKDIASALEMAQGTVRSAIEVAKEDGFKALAPKPTGRAVGQKRRLAAEQELRTSQDALRDAENAVALADDRERIARDLHDEVGPYLFAIQVDANAIAKSSDPKVYKDKVMEVTNAPGEKILPGELAKGLELLAAGTDIDYVGATSVELVEPGESSGVYREVDFKGGKLNVVGFR